MESRYEIQRNQSVSPTNDQELIPKFVSKDEFEQHIHRLSMPLHKHGLCSKIIRRRKQRREAAQLRKLMRAQEKEEAQGSVDSLEPTIQDQAISEEREKMPVIAPNQQKKSSRENSVEDNKAERSRKKKDEL